MFQAAPDDRVICELSFASILSKQAQSVPLQSEIDKGIKFNQLYKMSPWLKSSAGPNVEEFQHFL